PGTGVGGGDYQSPLHSIAGSSTESVTAANGVQLPAPVTATDSFQITADATAPATSVQFPVDTGGYDSNTWPTGSQVCTGSQPEGICGTVADSGSGVQNVKFTLQDLGGGQYYDGSGFSAGATTLSVTPAAT